MSTNAPKSHTTGECLCRRDALKKLGGGLAAAVALPALSEAAPDAAEDGLVIDPAPQHELSPFLYMQFMEPLGVTDSSVEASWDHLGDCWRKELVAITQELAPPMIRWGGIFVGYYRWREGVGPRDRRVPMHNLCWGGIESNQVGTAEFVDFCRQVQAEPLMCVNFESEGRPWTQRAKGNVRSGDAREAAAWVAYCNQPDHPERRAHGHAEPLTIRYWQLGNETSYSKQGFDLETAARKTVEFAKAMRGADPSIRLIGWGDSDWAPRMAEVAGEHLQYLAFHQMFNPDRSQKPVLEGELYRRDPAATWEVLMDAWKINDGKIRRMREQVAGSRLALALTECHFSIPGNNRNDVLRSWAAGVSYARILNNHQRHGDLLKIATAADFCGTRWTCNAVMIQPPGYRAWLMPVARVMRLYRRHLGTHAVRVTRMPDGLDAVASRSGEKLFVHVVNTRRDRSVSAALRVQGRAMRGGRVIQIAEPPEVEVSIVNADRVMKAEEKPLPASGQWHFPAASVSAVELSLS